MDLSETSSGIAARLRAAGCVFAEDEARLLIDAARDPADLAKMVERRVAGLPLEQVVGWAEFCGLRIAVEPGVFVPRRRTEFLARQAIALARQEIDSTRRGVAPDGWASPARQAASHRGDTDLIVVDMCCGTGAAGAALAAALERLQLHAVDIDPAAVRCARRNLGASGGQVYEGDLYEPLPASLKGRVDVIVANVPYVPTEEVELLPVEARLYEARLALDGGADGLEILRRVSAGASSWLAPGGHLLIETSPRQTPAAVEAFARGGLSPQVIRSDDLNVTVIVGTAAIGPVQDGPIGPVQEAMGKAE